MKTLLTLLTILATTTAAQAATHCSLHQNNGDGLYDKELYNVEISFGQDDDTRTQFAYVKPDGSVTRLNWKEVQEKKDFSDLDQSTFFTFRMTSKESLAIGFGDIDVSRAEVRRLIASSNAEGKLVVWALDRFVAICE
jgi:hypothetical protein